MELVINKEFNGIELYFEGIPELKIRNILKDHKFRWHSVKKCWFAKQTDENMKLANELNGGNITNIKEAKTTEKVNEYGIKVGDIFEYSWGYEQTNVEFFRVKELRGKTQVVLQEVYLKIKEEDGISGMSADRIYDVNEWSIAETSIHIKDNEKGLVKAIKGNKENPYISMDFSIMRKYTGQKVYESWYY